MKFNKVDEYMHEVVNKAKKDGYVETLFGRRRYINELQSSNFMVREFGKRAAMNTPIQGTAADIMKIAMNNVYKELKESKLDAKIVLQVHDELLIEVKDEDIEKAETILKRNMENAFKLNVPLKVDTNVAKTWYDVK
jgi:DNA polymerase-1